MSSLSFQSNSVLCLSGIVEQSAKTKEGVRAHHRVHAISCRSKPLNPVGHRINASTKMGFSFLFAEGWLEFGPSVEDVDPPAIGWSGDDGGRKNCSAA
jgi:hypothetical protein